MLNRPMSGCCAATMARLLTAPASSHPCPPSLPSPPLQDPQHMADLNALLLRGPILGALPQAKQDALMNSRCPRLVARLLLLAGRQEGEGEAGALVVAC